MAHTCNPSTWEADLGKLLSSSSAQTTEEDPVSKKEGRKTEDNSPSLKISTEGLGCCVSPAGIQMSLCLQHKGLSVEGRGVFLCRFF